MLAASRIGGHVHVRQCARPSLRSGRSGAHVKCVKAAAEEPTCRVPRLSVSGLQVTDAQVVDWGLTLLGVPEYWKETRGKGIKVAVLDTGIVEDHPDLKDRVKLSKDFTGSAIAATDNSIGVVGVAPEADLLCGKVLGDDGSGSSDFVVAGIKWAVEQGADIISMSLSGRFPHPPLEAAVADAIAKGVIVVAAAGNDGPGSFFRRDTLGYPGAYKDVICVGSIDRDGKRSAFSSVGYNIDIMAPGGRVRSCYIPPMYYAISSGTSMACPFIAGVCALALAQNRANGGEKLNQKGMFNYLKNSATDKGMDGFDKENGWGLVDVSFLEKLDA